MGATHFTGVDGVVDFGGVIAISEFGVDITRGVAAHPRSGHWSDFQVPGKVSLAGTLKRIMIDGSLLGYVVGDTAATGGADTLHAGLTAPGAEGESVTDMTKTDAQSSLIKFTALTAAITAAGVAVIYGTDINDHAQVEIVTIPTLGINETVTGKKVFKTVTHVAAFEWVQADGTLKVGSVTGASAIAVGNAKLFDVDGYADDGVNDVHMLMDNCFLTSGKFAFTDADTILSDEVAFTMRDPDADLSITYV